MNELLAIKTNIFNTNTKFNCTLNVLLGKKKRKKKKTKILRCTKFLNRVFSFHAFSYFFQVLQVQYIFCIYDVVSNLFNNNLYILLSAF